MYLAGGIEMPTMVGTESTVLHPTHDNLHWASRDLIIQLLPSHYSTGQLILRCLAEVGTIYSEVSQAPLESSRKEPIPERACQHFSAITHSTTKKVAPWAMT
uniref:Uncharacterized protein n=1 Tax=Anopheles culicifacies TaxID=139723 RepID=A0A182MIL7_9DIPT